MAQLRRPLIAALALFAGAITLDRIGVAAGDDVVATHAYLIALAFVAGPLVLETLRRASRTAIVAGALATHIATSMLLGAGPTGSPDTYAAATGLAFVAMASWLGHALAAALARIDDAVAAAAAGESPALDLEGATAASEIQTEVARARRHDRPLSVTVLAPLPERFEDALVGASVEIDRSIRSRFLFGSLARSVARQLRRSDLLFEHRSSGRLIVVSPETDDGGTVLLARRVVDAAARAGLAVTTGSASFPDDGISFESLLEHADRELQQSASPTLRSVDGRIGAA